MAIWSYSTRRSTARAMCGTALPTLLEIARSPTGQLRLRKSRVRSVRALHVEMRRSDSQCQSKVLPVQVKLSLHASATTFDGRGTTPSSMPTRAPLRTQSGVPRSSPPRQRACSQNGEFGRKLWHITCMPLTAGHRCVLGVM